MPASWLLVGLGNPGPDYHRTRHNAGFWFLEALARQSATPLRLDKGYQALLGRALIQAQEAWFCLPQQFMNRSGEAVAAVARFYRIPVERILVAHDDLDLPPGVVRLKRGGGNGGHNGLKDIDARLGSRDYLRLRIGIGHPGHRDQVVNYVLGRPSAADETLIHGAIDRALEVLPQVLTDRLEAAMHSLHSAG
ncbi:aminoacyl-tRNA hydrolase [Thermithiobacillus plumbiphilus]|uniref:Peptidyl-tRNA hydrolase n=1 Tax=Thermithiobacillus plumbiphilus TaxID=1729899 RepID=A0ABU9D821_9PROT